MKLKTLKYKPKLIYLLTIQFHIIKFVSILNIGFLNYHSTTAFIFNLNNNHILYDYSYYKL